MDKYKSFDELMKKEQAGKDYKIQCQRCSTEYVIMAPHGGGIERGTTETALSIAGDNFSYYSFSGIKIKGNINLHIRSERYKEMEAERLAGSSRIAITIHGESGTNKYIYVGGLNKDLKKKIIDALNEANFPVAKPVPRHLSGTDPNNICNKCATGKGVQIEISMGLRKLMFKAMNAEGRKVRKATFHKFVEVIRAVLNNEMSDNSLTVHNGN